MYSRAYVPMASSNGMRFTVPGAEDNDIMVAMLVSPKHMRHVVYYNDAIDVGKTCVSIMASMANDDIAVALGVYDLSLEMEMYLSITDDSMTLACVV